MESINLKKQHLSWRAGFGQQAGWRGDRIPEIVKHLLKQNEHPPEMIVTPEALQLANFGDSSNASSSNVTMVMDKDQKMQRSKLNQEGVKNLNILWLKEMFTTQYVLREKMALLWHGHFACRIQNVTHQQQLLQIIRANALGNFGDLLRAVSKSASMLQFLDNQNNRKQHPNENFGREVMELFTMGRGNYTEQDVKEGSRAFTGWTYNKEGDFVFRMAVHDNGSKTFLNKTGNFDGDDILTMLLEHKATAQHITEKIYKFLVNDTPDPQMIGQLADSFYRSNYNIKSLLEEIFTADWFYNNKNIGARIKSPVELIIGMERTVPTTFANDNALISFQRIMGQTLFYPPNVAGWPGGKSWIDSSTLMFRLRLPQIVYYAEELYIHPKAMPDEMDYNQRSNLVRQDEQRGKYIQSSYAKRIQSKADWQPFLASVADEPPASLVKGIADVLLVNAPDTVNQSLLENFSTADSKETNIKKLVINLMSTPEYQLC